LLFRPRTLPAVAAIFAENPNIMEFGRFKRSLSWEDSNYLEFARLKRSLQNSLRRNQKRPTFFARFLKKFIYILDFRFINVFFKVFSGFWCYVY
jgi:hypothetical protein